MQGLLSIIKDFVASGAFGSGSGLRDWGDVGSF